MPGYEGIVACLKEDGKAEVIIRPEDTGVPGASPQVNRCLRHGRFDPEDKGIEQSGRRRRGSGLCESRTSGLAKNAVPKISLTPLKERKGGIPLLVNHLVHKFRLGRMS